MAAALIDSGIPVGGLDPPKQKDRSHYAEGVGRGIDRVKITRGNVSMSRQSFEAFRNR
jgi:hypothetical protein